jgi:HEAT repeat protein
MMRCWAILAVVILLAGCGEAEPPAKVSANNKKPKPQRTDNERRPDYPPPAAIVDPNAFSSIPAALDALGKAAEAGDQQAISQADQWLVTQGAAAVSPLAAVLKNESAPLPQRIAVSRTLVQLPGAKAALLEAVDAKDKLVRVNVVQSLGRIKPADQQLVDKCIELAQGDDAEIQRYAVAALGKMGPVAKDAVPIVQKMLNDVKYNDTVRAEARKTLKAIDPRKGLIGVADE